MSYLIVSREPGTDGVNAKVEAQPVRFFFAACDTEEDSCKRVFYDTLLRWLGVEFKGSYSALVLRLFSRMRGLFVCSLNFWMRSIRM